MRPANGDGVVMPCLQEGMEQQSCHPRGRVITHGAFLGEALLELGGGYTGSGLKPTVTVS